MEENIYKKLLNLQCELKAPKGQRNTFGNYNYRSNEDILEAVKPLLKKYNLSLKQSDEMVEVGGRLYVKTTATLINIDAIGEKIENTAFAREEETKKGMDGSQITGASSSYARKYALNGLFAIDDTKDSDTTNIGETKTNKVEDKITPEQLKQINELLSEERIKQMLTYYKVDKVESLTKLNADIIIKKLNKETK